MTTSHGRSRCDRQGGAAAMHSTYSVASRADLWSLYEGFVVFFES